jgi:hypothetical protein
MVFLEGVVERGSRGLDLGLGLALYRDIKRECRLGEGGRD